MSLRTFVSGSAAVLVTWLALSFQHRGVPERYVRPQVADTEGAVVEEEPLVSVISSSH